MINHKPSKTNSCGVTTIEILIVTAVMLILLGSCFIGQRQREREFELQRSAFKIITDIERAREMAMSAEKFGTDVPEGGWGIHFDNSSSTSYILFADLRPDPGTDPDKIYSGLSEIKETIFLGGEKERVKLDSSFTPIDIVFVPPSPDVYLQGGTVVDEVEITIGIDDPVKTKTVIVNKAGLISAEN